MFTLANSFWVLACKCLFQLFGFILRYIFRVKADDSCLKNDYNCIEDQNASGSFTVLDSDGSAKEENRETFFEFRFQNSEDYKKRVGETDNSVLPETSPAPATWNTSKYQVISGNDFSGFMEEPETMRFTIQKLFFDLNDSNDVPIVNNPNQDSLVSPAKDSREIHVEKVQELLVGSNDCSTADDQMDNRVSADEDFHEFNSEAEAPILEKTEDPVEGSCSAIVLENLDQNNQETAGIEHNQLEKSNLFDEVILLSENQFLPSESIANEFFSEDEELAPENPSPIDEKKLEFIAENSNSNPEQFSIDDSSFFDRKTVLSRDESEDTDDDEYIDFVPISRFSCHLGNSFYTTDLGKVETKHKQENLQSTGTEQVDSLGKSKEQSSQDLIGEDEDGFDVLLKYQDLIEQMKMEIKNGKARGLPTILEESETPKMVEDLKPLKIDEKLEHKDRMEEIQKFYKSYAEKMRKLDVLNYQTMHAISFLQLKDPVQQTSSQKPSVSAIKSILFQNLWPYKLRRIYADPTLKSISELHRDLELVYVGQVCLSWEILHWQYGKSRELWEHDYELHGPYNQVAGEFQQFEVLIQRFVENEPFQEPRIQSYAKNRYELRVLLLQVPVIKDDCLKDKKEGRIKEENVVSIAILTEIIDESMRVFWEFLHADKDEANTILKGRQATHVGLQDPSDSELLMDVKTSLQKKEKRLKDILRSGNCMVKKFQKHQECRMDRSMLFAQVELKLVSRVLNMSRLTTDQLVWCQRKLNRISFFNRKIHVEPSFLLFPF